MTKSELIDLAKSVAEDQMDWLNSEMEKLMSPALFARFKCGELPDKEMGLWLAKEHLELIAFRNAPMLRLQKDGIVIAEFKPQLFVDGRPVDTWKVIDPNGKRGDVWMDEG